MTNKQTNQKQNQKQKTDQQQTHDAMTILIISSFRILLLSYYCCILCYAQQQTTTQRQRQQQRRHYYTQCTDLRDDCPTWAAAGECYNNSAYMTFHCPVSCHTCTLPRISQTPLFSSKVIPQTLKTGWEFPNAIGRKWGEPQILSNQDDDNLLQHETILQLLEQPPLSLHCRNRHFNCTMWALDGECEKNPAYMHTHCAPVCGSCVDKMTA